MTILPTSKYLLLSIKDIEEEEEIDGTNVHQDVALGCVEIWWIDHNECRASRKDGFIDSNECRARRKDGIIGRASRKDGFIDSNDSRARRKDGFFEDDTDDDSIEGHDDREGVRENVDHGVPIQQRICYRKSLKYRIETRCDDGKHWNRPQSSTPVDNGIMNNIMQFHLQLIE